MRMIVISGLAAAAVVMAFAAGCTSAGSRAPAQTAPSNANAPTAPPAHAGTARFNEMGLSFSYPAGWQAATWRDDVSDFSYVVVALSTTPQRDPCPASITMQGALLPAKCTEPVEVLPAGKVLVMWTVNGFPNWREPVLNAVIGGRRASETHAMAKWCSGLGGTETITTVIPRAAADNWYEMDACLRGPDLSQPEAQIADMLSSLRIAQGW